MTVSAETAEPGRYYAVLDGIRGLAAVAVVTLHVTEFFSLGFHPRQAHLAVDMFFMLSGIVIANAYEGRLRSTMSVGQFFTSRVVRLYPMVLLGVALAALTLFAAAWSTPLLAPGPVAMSLLSSALLLPSPFLLTFRPWAFPGNGPLWSLSAEMVVNIGYALMARALKLRVLILLAAAAAASWLLIATTLGTFDIGFAWREYPAGLARAASGFLIGIVIWRLLGKSTGLPLAAHLAPAAALAVLLAPLGPSLAFEAFAVMVLFPAVLITGIAAPKSDTLDRIWKRMGNYSYPIYALHYPIILMGTRAFHSAALGLGGRVMAAGATVLLIGICAHFALTVFDLPMRRALRRLPSLPLPTARPGLRPGLRAATPVGPAPSPPRPSSS